MNEEKVSIIVITYNSENWIIETLESIKNQTYRNLEIIISDDNSNDQTITKCQSWIEHNKNIFKNIFILKSDKNFGTSFNINKGIKKSTSNWIKIIAGDDILEKKCIENNIKYCLKYKYENLFSKTIKFKNDFSKNELIKESYDYSSFDKNAQLQFKELLLEGNFVEAPTGFFKKSLIEKMGYFDENYPLVEDYPMWLKMTEIGIKLNFMDEYTVYYRIHEASISNLKNEIINKRMFNFRKKIYRNYIKKRVKNPLYHYREKLLYIRNENIIKNGNKTKYTLISCVTYLLDPNSYLKIINKILIKIKK